MDSFEAARTVFARIQRVDPYNAHNIVTHILLPDKSEKEMIRLAFGPENFILSAVAKAKTELGLSSPPLHSIPTSRPVFSVSSAIHNPPSPSIWSNHLPVSPEANYTRTSTLSSSFNHTDSDNSSLEPSSNSLHFSDQFTEMSTEPAYFKSCFANEDPGSGLNYKPRGLSSVEGSSFDALEHYEQQLFLFKVAQQRRLAAVQRMSLSGLNSPYRKLNFLQEEPQRSGAAALTVDELNKLNILKKAGTDNSVMGFGDNAPTARQIFLTFPADSTFKEEDVSNYFSIYGAVQDVRIPYQQKRMFGFVTFVHPETVQIILTKGNPHFVCDSRVLVKPYKEKGKLTDKKQYQLDRFELLSSSSSSLLDREPFEMHVGPRLLYNNQDMLKKNLEQELHWQEVQRTRLMNIQLEDLKINHIYHHDFSHRSPSHLADNHETFLSQNALPTTNVFPVEALEENEGSSTAFLAKEPQEEVSVDSNSTNDNKKDDAKFNLSNERFELNLPCSSSASPDVDTSIVTPGTVRAGNGFTTSTSTTASSINTASCFLETPLFSSDHGTIGM